jgi:uncharacterized membrane protein
MAVASLVLSILTLVGVGSILGIVFGFVSRRTIHRSNGTQKGSGLALAGIIVGFCTLALVLVAIAIPTFLGVKGSNEAPSSGPGVIHLLPSPITFGNAVEGGQALPVPWESESEPDNATLTTVPGGVDMSIAAAKRAEYAGVPLSQPPGPSMQLSANVAITKGSGTNGIGLGCIDGSRTESLAFFVHDTGMWQILLFSDNPTALVDSGFSSAIHASGANTVAIACSAQPSNPDASQIAFEINGKPVASDIIDVGGTLWAPTVQLCSCDGADTGRYLDTAYYTSSGSPASSASQVSAVLRLRSGPAGPPEEARPAWDKWRKVSGGAATRSSGRVRSSDPDR